MWDGGELGAVSARVVVQLEQGNGEEFHVLGHGEDLYITALANTHIHMKLEDSGEGGKDALFFGS